MGNKALHLERFCYSETETEGRLWINAETSIFTLERPWRPGSPGGLPYASCVPDGSYQLVPHRRPNGDRVLALRNPDNAVFYTPDERDGRPGRDLILIHIGNSVDDVVGCIAPGMVRTIYRGKRWVGRSAEAMALVMQAFDAGADRLIIQAHCGTALSLNDQRGAQ